MPTPKQTPIGHKLAQWLPEFIPLTVLTSPNLIITEAPTPTYSHDTFWITTKDEKGKLRKHKIEAAANVTLALTDTMIWANYNGVGHGIQANVPSGSVILRTFALDGSGNLLKENSPDTQKTIEERLEYITNYMEDAMQMVLGILSTCVKKNEYRQLVSDVIKLKGGVDVNESVDTLGSASFEETFDDESGIDTNASSNYKIENGYIRVLNQNGLNQAFYDQFDSDIVGQVPAGWTVTAPDLTTALISDEFAYDGTKCLKLVGDSVHLNSNIVLEKSADLSGTAGIDDGIFSFWYKLGTEKLGHLISIKVRGNSADPWTVVYSDSLRRHSEKWTKVEFEVPNAMLTSTFQFRLEAQLADATNVVYIDDIQLWADMENNCTVVLNAIPTQTKPNNALAKVEVIDKFLNGSYIVSISRDGGNTWTQLVNGDDYTDISSQPNGTNVKLKLQLSGHIRIAYIGGLIDVDVVV